MKVVTVLNSKAGASVPFADQRSVASLSEAFQSSGMDAEIIDLAEQNLENAVSHAISKKPDAVIAAGGDGTVGAVAGLLVGTGVPLGVLPLGTFNHFAKDLNIPMLLTEAVELLAHPTLQQIDLAKVNGRYFVNNSSIGLYPHIVHDRDTQQRRLGRGKWLAYLFASLRAIRYLPFFHVAVEIEGETVHRRTPFVFVGNNEYMTGLFTIRRTCLNRGFLSLYVANHTTTAGFLGLAARALFNSLDEVKDFDSRVGKQIVIETKKRRLKIGIDGEVTTIAPPLRYTIHPRALHVIAPAATNDCSSESHSQQPATLRPSPVR